MGSTTQTTAYKAETALRRTPFVTARPTKHWSRGFMNAFELLPSAAKRRFRFSDGNNSKAFIKPRDQCFVGLAVTNGVRLKGGRASIRCSLCEHKPKLQLATHHVSF